MVQKLRYIAFFKKLISRFESNRCHKNKKLEYHIQFIWIVPFISFHWSFYFGMKINEYSCHFILA